ncbi:MAG: iron-sulfur cluster assembly protein [Promethearchaeota archaeon]
MSDELLAKINDALDQTRHPAINASLPALGMVKDVKIEEEKVHLTFKLPFPNLPESMKNMLIKIVQNALTPFGMNLKIKLSLMDEEEKQHFLNVENANWKGTPDGI